MCIILATAQQTHKASLHISFLNLHYYLHIELLAFNITRREEKYTFKSTVSLFTQYTATQRPWADRV